MLYRPTLPDATASSTTITGRSLARQLRHRSKTKRAFWAADFHRGTLRPCSLTVKQAAALAEVSQTYVTAALAASLGERLDILAGDRPLIKAKADDATLIQLAKTVGADRWIAAGIAAGL
jgi:hypothetical protein